MGSVTPQNAKSRARLRLIPWDPNSPEHVQRMFDQRIACGWNSIAVDEWRQLQRDGKIAMQWITISDSDPLKEARLSDHLKAFPTEKDPLKDTAPTLLAQPLTPTHSTFTPIGHISLDAWNLDSSLADASQGIYRIAAFYVSSALQSSGVGGVAMDEIERMAVAPPLSARRLTIMTIAREYPGKEERRTALGLEKEKFSVQDWYARRGYEAYMYQNNAWYNTDPTGKQWPATAVYMRKDIK